MAAIIDALRPYLPQTEGYLPYWMLLVRLQSHLVQALLPDSEAFLTVSSLPLVWRNSNGQLNSKLPYPPVHTTRLQWSSCNNPLRAIFTLDAKARYQTHKNNTPSS